MTVSEAADCGSSLVTASSFMPKPQSEYRNKSSELIVVAAPRGARAHRTMRKICAQRSTAKSVQGHQEDNDLADLLERTEHVAGLAADLGGAQPGHHPDRNGEQDQCREARQRA